MPSEFLSPSLVERKSRFLSHIMSGSYRYSGRESILFFQTNFLAPESVPCRTVYRILSTPPQTDRQTDRQHPYRYPYPSNLCLLIQNPLLVIISILFYCMDGFNLGAFDSSFHNPGWPNRIRTKQGVSDMQTDLERTEKWQRKTDPNASGNRGGMKESVLLPIASIVSSGS